MLVPTNMNGFNQAMQFINMAKSGNPQEIVMNMLQQRAGSNPMFSNLIGMIQNGNTDGVEQVVRNIAKEKGIQDFDKEFNSFKQMFKL